ncbi:MAG: hypothetical protein B6D41_01160 [Chloroflexi bacterium UTCFX4]|jgi:DNA primase catalytic core|nr:MAG: hypothetical protein B6D41_01160 [Chloroflexi bacterium UTCFX4]
MTQNDKTKWEERRERVRAANPIQIIAARYTQLTRAGRQLKGLCPLHQEDTPSFVVYPEQGRWWCYGACQTGGDMFTLVMLKEGLDFKAALAFLENEIVADSSQVPIARAPRDNETSQSFEVTEEHYTYLTLAKDVYRAALGDEHRLLRYLDERRIDGEAVRRFQIGYADGESLQRYFNFRSWKWIPALAQELGLVRKDKRGNEREYFRERLVIPDLDGERATYLVGRGTRAEQKIKYIGLSGVPKPLFGLARVERGGECQRVFVTEGPFDALTLMMWDLPAVCLLGSYLKKDFLRALERFERVYIVTDFDAAGRTAAHVIACQLGARAVIVPRDPSLRGKDVNELAQHYRDAAARFETMIARADAHAERNEPLQNAIQRLRNHLTITPERKEITQVLLEKLVEVIVAEIARGHTVVLWSRAYEERGQAKSSRVRTHVIRGVGTLHGTRLRYSARRGGRAEEECDLATADYGEVAEEACS